MSETALAGRPALAGRDRKADTRERLLDAARFLFCERGYLPASVEDIAMAAAVTRMTLYRHFPGKVALAIELYRQAADAAMPRLVAIRERNYRDPVVVRGWIAEVFDADRSERRLLRAFNQAAAAEPAFTERAQQMIGRMIAQMGETISAFAVAPDASTQRRRWLEAWLLLYELLDQSNHAALESGVATDPLVIDVLAERFLRFAGGPVS